MPFEATAGRIHITDDQGGVVLDTDEATLHVVDYKHGTTTLPRVANPPWGSATPEPAVDIVQDLGAVSAHAQILGGVFRISNAEGLSLGERRYLSSEGNGGFSLYLRYLYAPRIQTTEWFSAGGVNLLDIFQYPFNQLEVLNSASGGPVPEVGKLFHAVQFIMDNGRLKLIRGGNRIASRIITQIAGSQSAGFTFDCAALTIEYRIWLGAFT